MTYWALRCASWLLMHVHEAIGYPVCALLGRLYFSLTPGRRRLLERNLQNALGPCASAQEVGACARRSYVTLVENYFTLFHMPGFERDYLRKRLHVEGMDHLSEAIAKGRGVILAGLHLGNGETLMQIPTLYPELRFVLLVEKLKNPGLQRALYELRTAMGVEVATTDEPLRVIRRLRENGTVGMACDRDVTGSGVLVDFFGKPARLPDGPVRIAARTGAALIPAYGWRDEKGNYAVQIEPALLLQRTGDADADTQANMRVLACALESAIRKRPCQWMPFHHVWV